MMRIFSILLVGIAMSIGVAGSASALSITDEKQHFDAGSTQGYVEYLSLTESGGEHTLRMRVGVEYGRVSRARVFVESASGDRRTVTDAGSEIGSDVNVRRVHVSSDGSVQFAFKASFFHYHIHAGEQSNPFWVSYSDLAEGDVVTFAGFRNNIFGSFGSVETTIVPEPSTAMLVGLGVIGLAVAGRRR